MFSKNNYFSVLQEKIFILHSFIYIFLIILIPVLRFSRNSIFFFL